MAQGHALSGFPEWLPEQELVQQHLIEIVRTQYELHGFTPITTRSVESLDDHRLAMTFAIAGLIGSAPTMIERPSSVAVSYPGFFAELEGVRA